MNANVPPPFVAPPPLNTNPLPVPPANPDLRNGLNAIANENPMALILATNDNLIKAANALNANTVAMVNAFNTHSASLHQALNLIPMRLYNATASSNAPLQYPPGIVVGPGGPLPITPADARTLSGQGYTAAIAALAPGLAPLPGNPTVATKRAYFLGYIGCPP